MINRADVMPYSFPDDCCCCRVSPENLTSNLSQSSFFGPNYKCLRVPHKDLYSLLCDAIFKVGWQEKLAKIDKATSAKRLASYMFDAGKKSDENQLN